MGRRWETRCIFGPAFCLSDICRLESFESYLQRCAPLVKVADGLLKAFLHASYSEAVTGALSCTISIYPLNEYRAAMQHHSVTYFFPNSSLFCGGHIGNNNECLRLSRLQANTTLDEAGRTMYRSELTRVVKVRST